MQVLESNDATFGPNVAQTSSNLLNMNNFTDSNGNPLSLTSFMAGNTIYLNATECACNVLQPQQYANANTLGLCLMNATNVGKTFTLQIENTNGKQITQTSVAITS